jgi:hypothetical protein
MSVPWNTVYRQVALSINAIAGPIPTTLESNYATVPQNSSIVVSADFPFTAILDACVKAEEKLVHTVSNVGDHPWRQAIGSHTANIANEGLIPATDFAGKPIIGILGSVYDSSDGTVLWERNLVSVSLRAENPNGFFKVSAYEYKIDGNRIYHTRTNVQIDCCVYERPDISALNTNILLPDVLEEAYVCGAISMLVRDDAFMPQSAVFRGYFNDTLQMISQGLHTVPPKVSVVESTI